jgi:hypothetical protein
MNRRARARFRRCSVLVPIAENALPARQIRLVRMPVPTP